MVNMLEQFTDSHGRKGGPSSGSSSTGKFFVLTVGGLVIDGRALMAMGAAFLVAAGMCMA